MKRMRQRLQQEAFKQGSGEIISKLQKLEEEWVLLAARTQQDPPKTYYCDTSKAAQIYNLEGGRASPTSVLSSRGAHTNGGADSGEAQTQPAEGNTAPRDAERELTTPPGEVPGTSPKPVARILPRIARILPRTATQTGQRAEARRPEPLISDYLSQLWAELYDGEWGAGGSPARAVWLMRCEFARRCHPNASQRPTTSQQQSTNRWLNQLKGWVASVQFPTASRPDLGQEDYLHLLDLLREVRYGNSVRAPGRARGNSN